MDLRGAQGRVLACCSTLLSAALLLATAFLSTLHHPAWSRPALVLEVATWLVRPWLDEGGVSPSIEETDPQSSPKWSHYEVELALMECLRLLAPATAEVVPMAPTRDGDCGAPAPVLLRSLGKEKVAIDPPLLLNCPMIVALDRWLETTVQTAALEAFGSPVARIVGSSYSCRTAYNRPDTRLSQHAFANAVDLPVFILANGRRIDVAKEWGATRRDLLAAKAKLASIVANKKSVDPQTAKPAVTGKNGKPSALTVAVKASTTQQASPTPETKAKGPTSLADTVSTPEAKFWRRIHHGACEGFSTVLGPEANEEHRNHLHLDLQERNTLAVCE